MHDEQPVVETLELGGRPARSASLPRLLAWVVAAVVALVLLLGLGNHAYVDDRLPRRSVVAGVALGGLTRDAAEERLRNELGPRSEQPFDVTIGPASGHVLPSNSGLSVDFTASIDQARPGGGWSPTEGWRVLTGGSASTATVIIDQAKLRRSVVSLAQARDSDPIEPQIEAAGTEPRVVAGRDGVRLKRATAATQIVAAYLTATGTVPLAYETRSPMTRPATTEAFLTKVARPALSTGVRVDVTGHGSFTVKPTELARVVVFANHGDDYEIVVDGDTLRSQLPTKLTLPGARTAEVTYFDERCIRRKAVIGPRIDTDRLANDLAVAVTGSGSSRRVTATVVDVRANLPDEAAQRQCR